MPAGGASVTRVLGSGVAFGCAGEASGGLGGLPPQGRGGAFLVFDRLSAVTIVPAFRAGPPVRTRFPFPDDT